MVRQQPAALRADVAAQSGSSLVHIRPLRKAPAATVLVLKGAASGVELVASTAAVAAAVAAALGVEEVDIEAELVWVAVVEGPVAG